MIFRLILRHDGREPALPAVREHGLQGIGVFLFERKPAVLVGECRSVQGRDQNELIVAFTGFLAIELVAGDVGLDIQVIFIESDCVVLFPVEKDPVDGRRDRRI